VTILAGAFVAAFGACGAWFITKRFPQARFLQTAYVVMAGGGVAFVTWSLSKVLAIGVAAVALLAVGGVLGIFGALRKELRY
jgi:hypothetical protein